MTKKLYKQKKREIEFLKEHYARVNADTLLSKVIAIEAQLDAWYKKHESN